MLILRGSRGFGKKIRIDLRRYRQKGWFIKGMCDGFAVQSDLIFVDIADFIDYVIQILQQRELLPALQSI